MKIGWLADATDHVGGAELTQAEFALTAPQGVEILSCPPGEVSKGLDAYVIHNCVSYHLEEIKRLRAPLFKYVHDMWPAGDPTLRAYLLRRANLFFTSPLHVERFPHRIRGKLREVPPAIQLERFQARENGHREGACCIGRMSYGKGTENLETWAEPVDVYSPVAVPSRGNLHYIGARGHEAIPEVLSRYARFVFLPTAPEPFGRAVVEAWASGLELHCNRNVGALHWIRENPKALTTAPFDFWEAVTRG